MKHKRQSVGGHRGWQFGSHVRRACPPRRSVWQELQALVRLKKELSR